LPGFLLLAQHQPVPGESTEEYSCRESYRRGYAILPVVVELARRNRHHCPRWGGAGVLEAKTLAVDILGSSLEAVSPKEIEKRLA
jgi:hypothetical protein